MAKMKLRKWILQATMLLIILAGRIVRILAHW